VGLNGIEGKVNRIPINLDRGKISHKIVIDSTTTKTIEKLRTDLESIEF